MFAAASTAAPCNPELAREVAEGLMRTPQKTLPASCLYDELGSALFEAITVLPEYGVTRAEAGLLRASASEMVGQAGNPALIVELGSGTGSKTRHILEATNRVDYMPVDISPVALENCAASLRSIAGVRIHPIEGRYLDGIDIALGRRRAGERALILFLGSTIGNFTPDEAAAFLQSVLARVLPGDGLLLGADLAKPRSVLIPAYDDPLGVTAAFNLNLLARINRELDGEFRLDRFEHEARWNYRDSRVEMHLRSTMAQRVRVGALDLTVSFAQDETIWTESSHKYRIEEVRRIGEGAGWDYSRQWIEDGWGFAETLFTAPDTIA